MIKTENFITIQGWMTQLDIKGNELIAYALIYGFSQDGESYFQGTSSYISEWLGVSKVATLDILKRLVEKKYIIKQSETKNNVTYCNYKFNQEVVKKLNTPDKETLPPQVKKVNHPGQETLPPPGKETLPHNITTNNNQNINTKKRTKKADYNGFTVTQSIHDRLVSKYGEKVVKQYYEKIDNYELSSGKHYKDYSATAVSWIDRDIAQGKGPKPLPPPPQDCPACGSRVITSGCNTCTLEKNQWGRVDYEEYREIARIRGHQC
jgi:hypothetical protein